MSCVIQIVGWANGQTCNAAGKFVRSVDVQKAPLTEEWLITTPFIDEAYRWDHASSALRVYMEVLQSDPKRPDGKPNRPFTALTIQIIPVTPTGGDGSWKSFKSR